MNEERKYSIKDLEKALEHFKKQEFAMSIRLEFDHLGRILLRAGDSLVTIYEESSSKYPEVTKTQRL